MLEELRAEGQFDSEGHFTLDPERAREMLACFTHDYPRQHLQDLVSAAVCLGASLFEIRVRRGVARVEFDGATAAITDFDHLLEGLATDRQPAGLRWLALGVLGALRESSSLVLESSSGVQLLLVPDQCPQVRAISAGGVSTRLRIHYRLSLRQRLAAATRGPLTETIALERCRGAPLQLNLQGRRANRVWQLDGRWPLVVQGRSKLGPVKFKTEPSFAKTEQAYSLALAFPEEETGVQVIAAGVTYPLLQVAPYGCKALYYRQEVATNLGRRALTQSERERIAEDIRTEIEAMVTLRAQAGEMAAWHWVQLYWERFSPTSPILQTPLLPTCTGELVSLARLRGRAYFLVGEDYPELHYRNDIVLTLKAGDRVKPRVPLARLQLLPRWGWVADKSEMPRASKLPYRKYAASSRFEFDGLQGECGLTPEPEISRPALSLTATGLVEAAPMIALPAGLHLLVVGNMTQDQEFWKALVPLYHQLLRKRLRADLRAFHLLEYLDYVARVFWAVRDGLPCTDRGPFACSPYQGLLHPDPAHPTFALLTRLELQYTVEEFVHFPFLLGGVAPSSLKSGGQWKRLSARLSPPQAKKLAAFLGLDPD